MKRVSLLVALVVVVGMLLVPAAAVVAQEQNEGDGDSEDVHPGERLSGVVGVQSAEVDGEVERNAYAIALERADDNATKASHIAEKLNETERRLAGIEERQAELREQRESGEMTEGKYRARMAITATELETAKEQLNRSGETAAGLPPETLEENGVNTTAIRTLQHSASEMSGQEVSEIARDIAGDRRGGMIDRGADTDRGDDRGPDRENATAGNSSGASDSGENVSDERSDASTDRDSDTDQQVDASAVATDDANDDTDDNINGDTADDTNNNTADDANDNESAVGSP